MNRKSRRHKTGFGYIGFGNNTNIFNRKPRKVFSETKHQLNTESLKKTKLKFNSSLLTKEEKTKLKTSIRKKARIKLVVAILTSTIVLFFLIYITIFVFEALLFKH